jgi:hypothetical protein
MTAAPRQKGAQRRPKEDKSMKRKVVGSVVSGGQATKKGLQGIVAPSLQSYFWWSTLFYLSAFIVLTIVTPKIDEFFCAVDPLEANGGMGCSNCPDTLIFCDVQDECYRTALNATYHGFSKDPADPFYGELQLASADKAAIQYANTLDMASVTPLEVVKKLTTMASEVAPETLIWHCEVYKMALGQYEFTSSKPDVWGVGEKCATSSYAGKNWSEHCPIQVPTPTPAARRLTPSPSPNPCDTASEGAVGGCEQSAARGVQDDRRLTDEVATYSVSEWAQCTCYTRCMPGLKIRTLICSSGDGCVGNPPDSEVCECAHCARCDVALHLLVMWYTCLSQVVISFLSFLAYLYGSTINEDTLVKVSWSRLLPGFVCKWLPPTVKYCVVANLVNLIIMGGRIYAPDAIPDTQAILDATGDCRASESLRTLYVVLVCLWVFQVALSSLARRFARPPPWLLEPQRNSLFNGIRKLTQCFGP